MNILAIDSTAEQLVVCGSFNGKTASQISNQGSKKHNSLIMQYVDYVCGQLGVTVDMFDCFACVIGAGSFTGIRIGIATAKALSIACKKPCVSLTSFEQVAYNIKDEKFAVTIDARHDNFYAAIFENNWTNCVEMGCFSKTQLESMGIKIYEKKSYSCPDKLIATAEYYAKSQKFSNLMPLYLKKSQAEREKDGD